MKAETDLYAQYQSLAALVSVLLHDLRNPLHSATLLVEAMGMRTADVESLRGKLRSQFAKLDALISEANGSIRELQLDTRPELIGIDELLARTSAQLKQHESELTVTLPPPTNHRVSCDPTLLSCAMCELALSVAELAKADGAAPVTFSIDTPEPDSVRIAIGSFSAVDPALIKSPFSIAGGGVRLALARGLAQQGGASLRLDRAEDGVSRYTVSVKRAP